jgi:hypothetical protein
MLEVFKPLDESAAAATKTANAVAFAVRGVSSSVVVSKQPKSPHQFRSSANAYSKVMNGLIRRALASNATFSPSFLDAA